MLENQLEYIRKITDFTPEIAMVLGSGLGDLADEAEIISSAEYGDIPDFPVSTAPSHRGRFLFGMLEGKKVAVMQGRVHLYEGYTPQQVVMPIRLLRKMGVKKLLLTNAAGGIDKSFKVGDFMIIDDHISSFVPSSLIGKNNEDLGVRFPDMSCVYSERMRSVIKCAAEELNIDIKHGTYVQFTGPCFETPAEIKMASFIGASAVGMSTVIEAQAAVHCGMEVSAISLISNMASGISENPLSSQEVEEAAFKAAPYFRKLIKKSVGGF